jgi:MFS family permease
MSVPLLLFTAVITGFGNGVLRPALTSLISHQAGKHEQGTVLGVSQALMSGASVVIPILSGLLIEANMLAWWCWTAAIFGAIGWALSIGGARESPGLKAA